MNSPSFPSKETRRLKKNARFCSSIRSYFDIGFYKGNQVKKKKKIQYIGTIIGEFFCFFLNTKATVDDFFSSKANGYFNYYVTADVCPFSFQ